METYYLHQIDTPRGHIIIIDNNPETQETHTYLNGSPIIYEDGTPVPNKIGWTLGPVTTENEAKVLALTIAQRYNWDVQLDGKLVGLPYLDRHDAAVAMGSAKSERKASSSRENGKKGGRPHKPDHAK